MSDRPSDPNLYTIEPTNHSIRIGEIIARAIFQREGDPLELDAVTEQQLTQWCASAVQAAFDGVKEALRK